MWRNCAAGTPRVFRHGIVLSGPSESTEAPLIVHINNALNWKSWKNGGELEATRDARLMEMADILHFFVQLALDQGFSAEEMHEAYVAKNLENQRRQQSDPR